MNNLIVIPGVEDKMPAAKQPDCERDLEPRLQQLCRLVKDLAGSSYPLLVMETARIRQGLGDLVVQEEAMRWIFRLAKDCEAPVRTKLLAHVADAVSDLERIAESLLYAECT